jgi:hypothetical protein
MKKLETSFGEVVKDCQIYKTLGTPNNGIVQPKDDEPKILDRDKSVYHSVVGSLLHLTKHSRPDISNAVRELSKCTDGAAPPAYKEMKRLVKFVINTSDYGLKVKPSYSKGDKWKITVFMDSDWVGDKNNRHSVSVTQYF